MQQADDPLLAFVEFADIAVREARRVEAPGWAQILVQAEGGPLLLAGSPDGRRVAILTFDLHASDLPLRISFPVLMANLMDWFAPARAFDAPDGLTPGESLVVRPQASTTSYRVTHPDGGRATFDVTGGALLYTDTSQLGLYTLDLLAGAEVQSSGQFAVNLFAPEESDITPRESVTIGQTALPDLPEDQEVGQRELWAWVALAAFVILLLEWWVYHRGSRLPHQIEGTTRPHLLRSRRG
mgnify:CR=1 FL=1